MTGEPTEFASLEEQAREALHVAEGSSIEVVTAGLVSSAMISPEAASASLASRFGTKANLTEMAAAVRGLRNGEVTLAVRDWLEAFTAAGFPRKLATTAVILGATPSSFSDNEALKAAAEIGSELHRALGTRRLPVALASSLIDALLLSSPDATTTDRVDALAALAKAVLTEQHRIQLAAVPMMLDDACIEEVVSILDAAEAIDPAIAAAWVGARTPTA